MTYCTLSARLLISESLWPSCELRDRCVLTFFSSWRWASLLGILFTCSRAALLAALMAILVPSPSCLIILPMAFTVSASGLL